MKASWMSVLGRKEALLLGVSAAALFTAKPAAADTTANGADATLSANEAGSVAIQTENSVYVDTDITIAGNVDNTSTGDATGYLVFSGNSTVGGSIGSTNVLNSITAGVNGTNVQFDGTLINVVDMQLSSDGSVTLGNGVTLTGNIDNTSGTASTGEVVFAGTASVVGAIGTTATISTITAGVNGSDVQFNGNVGAAAVNLSSDGSITLVTNTTVSGVIDNTSGTASVGELVMMGSTTVAGAVGSTNSLSTITAGLSGAGAEFDGNVSASVINLSSDGTVIFGNGVSVTGMIDNTEGNASMGQLQFDGNGTVSGLVGSTNTLSTITAGVTATNVQFDSNVGAAELNITSDGSVTFADGVTLSGCIDDTVGVAGEVVFAGNSTIAGTIGGSNAIATLSAGVTGTNVQFDGTAITASDMNLTSDGSVTIGTGVTLTGNIDNTSGTASTGEVVFAGTASVVGAIGTTNTVSTITAGVNNTDVQFNGAVGAAAINLSSDGSVTLVTGTTVSGVIDNTSGAASVGELVMMGSTTVAGAVGSTNSLSTITAGLTGAGAEFDGNVTASVINLSSDGTLIFGNGVSVTGLIDNTEGNASMGQLQFDGNGTVSGSIGTTNTLSTITAGVTGTNVQFDSNIGASEINITSDGSVTFAEGVTLSGNIDDTVGLAGEVVFAGNSTVAGTLGASNFLSTVTAGASGSNVSFTGTALNVSTINLSSDGSLTIAASGSVGGVIDNTSGTASTGEVVFAGDATVVGAVGSTNSLSTITAGVNGTQLDFTANVAAGVINLTSDGSVVMASGTTLTGMVDSAIASTGELVFAGDGTVTGAIGSTNNLSSITAGETGNTVQFESNVAAVSLLASNGTIVFADGASLSGLIDGNTTGGTVTFNGNNTVTGTVGAGTTLAALSTGASGATTQFDATTIAGTAISAGAGTTLFTGSAPTISGDLTVTNGGTLQFSSAAGASLTAGGGAGNLDMGGTSSTLKLKMTDIATFASLTTAGTANMRNANVYIDLSGTTASIASGTTITIVNSVGATSNADVVVASSSAAVTFTSTSDANNVYLTSSRTGGSYAGAASGAASNVSGVSTVLTSLVGTTGSMASLVAKLDTLGSSDLGKALTQLTPAATNANVSAANSATGAVIGAINTRVASLQGHQVASADGDMSGFAAGEGDKRRAAWIQVLGSFGDQGKRQGQDGYESATYGVALGADTKIGEKGLVGLSFAYGNTSVDATGDLKGNKTDVNSYVLNGYGSYDVTSNIYVDANVGFALHQFDTSRVSSLVAGTAKGSHDGYQYLVGSKVGYKFALPNRILVTPFAGFEYSHLSQDGYTETGTGGMPLKVNSVDTDSFKIGGGVRASGDVKRDTLVFRPEVHGGVFYDVIGDRGDQTATFTGGGAAFTTTGVKPAQTSFNAGLGLTVITASDLQLSATYDADVKDQFLGHTGALKVRMPF